MVLGSRDVKMKLCALMLLTLAANTFAQSNGVTTPAPRPRLTEELRRTVAKGFEDSASNPAVRSAQPSGQDAVMMAPFQVTSSRVPIYGRPQGTDPIDRPFTWKTGGTFFRNDGRTFTTKLMVEYDPGYNVINLLKIYW